MGILPWCRRVSTTVLLHHLNSNKTHGRKTRYGLYKDSASFWISPGSSTIKKKTVVRPLTSYLANHSRKANKTAEEVRTNS